MDFGKKEILIYLKQLRQSNVNPKRGVLTLLTLKCILPSWVQILAEDPNFGDYQTFEDLEERGGRKSKSDKPLVLQNYKYVKRLDFTLSVLFTMVPSLSKF